MSIKRKKPTAKYPGSDSEPFQRGMHWYGDPVVKTGRERMTEKKRILFWELAGAFFIVSLGSLLHFVFAWFDGWPPLALFAAVNESIWEHLKMVFWPGFLFALFSIPFFKGRIKNYWIGKTAGLITMPLIIVILFYAYRLLFGGHNLIYDIGIFVLAAFAGQWLGYRIMVKNALQRFRLAAYFLLVLCVLAFSLFTFFPPRVPLFRCGQSGEYGILEMPSLQ